MSEVGEYATVFKALSDPLRLRLLEVLPGPAEKGTFCVCDLAARLGVSQPCLSHHLGILKNAGLVGSAREGCSVYYFIDRERVTGRLEEFRRRIEAR